MFFILLNFSHLFYSRWLKIKVLIYILDEKLNYRTSKTDTKTDCNINNSKVEIVNKHGAAARRLYIRGHNGKIYPYLVVNDSGLSDARREERVLQLLRMLNHLLAKHKETSRRFLNVTVARVVAVSPQMRLVQDNTNSIR